MRGYVLAGLAWALAVAAPAAAVWQEYSPDAPAIQAFERRVEAYVDLHHRLEGPLPTLKISDDLRDVHAAMDALAKEIRTARKGARQGDLFTPDVVGPLRDRIAGCRGREELAEILAENDEHTPARLPRLRVNDRWPHVVPYVFVPPEFLRSLPRLPPELQYRIIGRTLVLWDHHADLIVDFLPEAFPR
jgi:hypothetical protein